MRAAVAGLLLTGLLAGCVEDGDLRRPPAGFPVPDAIYRAAADYAIGRLGPGYFERLYAPDETASRRVEPWCAPGNEGCTPVSRTGLWSVAFDIGVPGRDDAPFIADVPVLDDGTIAWDKGHEDHGFPDCRHDLRECRFVVDGDRALALARDDGLRERGCPLLASFHWAPEQEHPPTFAWTVSDGPCPHEGDAEGESRTVDANSGRIVRRSGWSLISN